jgi:hypothetical protein
MPTRPSVLQTLLALLATSTCQSDERPPGADAGHGDLASPVDSLASELSSATDADPVPQPDASLGVDGGAGEGPRPIEVAAFEPVAPGISDSLRAVFVAADGAICVGGAFLGIRCFRAGGWTDHQEGIAPYSVSGLWGDDSGLKLASGGAKRIWSSDGTRWTLVAEMDGSCSVGPKVFGLTDGHVVGTCSYYSGLARFKLGDPDAAQRASGLTFLSRDAFAFSAEDVFVLAAQGIRRYRGGPWTDVASWPAEPIPAGQASSVFDGIWSPAHDELVAVGQAGVVVARKGGVWQAEDSGTEADLADVWCAPGVGCYAVGKAGTIIFRDGTSWRRVQVPTSADLHAVHGLADGTVVVVGDAGTVLRAAR